MSGERLHAALLILVLSIAALLYGAALGNRGFWEPDEPTFPAVAQEMRAAGDWILPRLNGGLYSEKPILNYWMILVSATLFGRLDEGTARVPAAALGVLGVALAYLLGRRLFGARAGLWGALLLAVSPLYLRMARFAYTDGPFAVFFLASLYLFYRGYADASPDAGGRRLSYRLAWVALALAVLTKGPLAIVLLGLAVATFLALMRDLRHLLRIEWPIGLLLLAVLVTPWYVAATRLGGPEFAYNLVVRQNLERFTGSYESHVQPVYHYLVTVPVDFFPWSLFLPGAVFHLVRQWRSGVRRREIAFLVAVFVPAFLFLSITSSKQGKYLLPAFPALALAAGAFVQDAIGGRLEVSRRFFTWPLAATGGFLSVLGLAGVALAALPDTVTSQGAREALPAGEVASLAGQTAAFLIPLAAAIFVHGPDRRPGAALTSAALCVSALYLYAAVAGLPVLDRFKSPKPLCDRIVARLGDQPEFALYGNYREGFSYYTRQRIRTFESEKDLEAYLDEPDRAFVLMRDDRCERLPVHLRARLEPLERGQVGTKAYVFLAESTRGRQNSHHGEGK